MNNLIPWDDFVQAFEAHTDDFVQAIEPLTTPNAIPTDIACPKCGQRLWRRTDIVLTTYLIQVSYKCPCGWYGTVSKKISDKVV